jgi:N6-L-threonylcarbamoyladenine synthase
MLGRPEPHFSFAGLKTAVRHAAKAVEPLSERDVSDLCASFEAAVTDSVRDRVAVAMRLVEDELPPDRPRALVVAGGVAANAALRTALQRVCAEHGFTLLAPPPAMCTDNGAMIAWAGAERLALGLIDPLSAAVRPRWPLDPTAPPAIGAGVKA